MRRYSTKRRKLSYLFVALLILGLVFSYALISFAENKLESIVSEDAEQKTSEIIYNELSDYLKEKGDIGELVHMNTDKDGNILGITTDSAKINAINNELGTRLSKSLNALKDEKASFPIGAVSGIDLLSGKGFDVDVSYHSISNISTDLVSEFENCGINQTKHTLKFIISAKINAVMPANNINIKVCQEFLISETVIVGKIPAVYLNND